MRLDITLYIQLPLPRTPGKREQVFLSEGCLIERLRTVATLATAHTFCASRDGLRKSGFLTAVPAKTKIFFVVYNYAGKVDISKGYCNAKRKLEVTTHFSEIIKVRFEKNSHIVLYFSAF